MRPVHVSSRTLTWLLLGPSLLFGCRTPVDDGVDGSDGGDGFVDDAGDPGDALPGETEYRLNSVSSNVDSVLEGERELIQLSADYQGHPDHYAWVQTAGPPLPLQDHGPRSATVELTGLDLAAPVVLGFSYEVEVDGETESALVEVPAWPVDLVPTMGERVQIGGATSQAHLLAREEGSWVVHNVANKLRVTPLATKAGEVAELVLPAMIQDVVLVSYDGRDRAVVAMGPGGIAVVDLTAPMKPVLDATVTVDYYQDGISFAEGGGDIVTDNVIEGSSGAITALVTDGSTLWIGDADYGLHKTSLDNLLGAKGPVLDETKTLTTDLEVYALQYAGENPWGGPMGMKLVDDRLFVAQGFLGLVIYDANSLERVAWYNLYTDASMVEDWFIDQDVAALVQTDAKTGEAFLDAVTGMPDYRQANFEIAQVWHGDVDAPTPWADFDRYGKYYYNAWDVDLVTRGEQDTAYVAYGMGGLVAVDVTGFRGAGPGDAALHGSLLGYAPAVPANGPDGDDAYGDTSSLYPHYGAGMLKEAGVVDVKVTGDTAWYADHFAGLVALSGAADPGAEWHGPLGAGAYDNDDPSSGDGVLGDHQPDYEFVTSYDMSPYDSADNESLPAWMFEEPCLMASGEVSGHGGPLQLVDGYDFEAPGSVDILQATGGGGLIALDILDLEAPVLTDRFALLVAYPTTDEVGAAADGSPTQAINIGHSQGVAASEGFLYLGDGPHGMSVWQILDESGMPIDEPHLVANTLQDEYPVTVDGVTVYPTPHASVVVYDPVEQAAFSLSQSLGLRRVDASGVEGGAAAVGAPLLLAPGPTDIFEHNGDWGRVSWIRGQDHAYDLHLDGNLAYVADGTNGLTVYDLSADPTDVNGGFAVGNIGDKTGRPYLGRATGVDLWTDPHGGTRYAFVAAGPYGVGVVDISDPTAMSLVKLFEPIKLEDDTVGKADGRCVDVHAIGDVVYYSYSSFGVVAYSAADLIEPLPEGVDPTDIWDREGTDYRPEALARVELTDFEGYEDADYESLYMEPVEVDGTLRFYIAAGAAGVWVLDWTDPTAPTLVDVADTVGEATSVALSNGRVYVADGSGGVAAFE